jgi:SAM-dependent methyltransferase
MTQASIESVVSELREYRNHSWAWTNFLPTVERLIQISDARKVIEIGGGRSPSFSRDQLTALGVDYVSNDISERELSKAPAWVGKAHFDIQTPDSEAVAPFADSFDMAFSKMVMEHVRSYERAYRNIYRILRKGGISIAFHPTLFASPFLINKIMPEWLSGSLLRKFFPRRIDEDIPKFPAYYSGCAVSDRIRDKIGQIGFGDVWQIPFFGHGYYAAIPIARNLQAFATRKFRDASVERVASYAFTIVRK